MSSGLMASAQMRMKQKREKASQSKVTSPSSIASPSSAGVASPSNMNGFGGNSNSGSKKHSMMNTASAPQGVSQPDFMPPEHTTYASPPQYSANNNNNNTSNRYQHQNNSYNASPLASSPNRHMRKEEQFDTAIQRRGNYTHHLKARNTPSPSKPRRGYDSYTDAPKEEQERLNQQYYQQQAPPPPPPTQRQQQKGFAPSSRNVPNNHSRNERMNPYIQDSQDEAMMDGGEYEYDITEDEEAYVNERNDRVTVAPTLPQGRTPVYSQPVAEDENETVSSEIALNGNPTTKKKKERKSKKAVVSSSKDARYGIHNVGSDDAMDKPAIVSDARYGIHHTASKDNGGDDGDNNEHGRASPERQYNYGDIAAHAGRYAAAAAAASETTDPLAPPKPNRATTNPFDDDSFGSKGGQEDGGDEGDQNEHFVSADSESNNDQQNMWDDDISSTMQKFDRNSKSWDQENKNSFEKNLWAGSFFGESGSVSKQSNEEQPPDAAVAAQEAPQDKELDSVMDKKYPWKGIKEYAEQTEAEIPLSDAESDDDDTLFVFDKKKQNAAPNNDETSTDPNETFNKISQGIQQADEARNAAQTLQRARSGGSTEESSAFLPDESKFGTQGPTSPSRSVAFVGEAGNKVHTYHVQRHSRDHSGSDSGTYETRDDEDDETDGETLDDGDTLDNYTLDDATYGDATYGESTIGGTTLDTRGKEEVENETNIMDHVDSAVKAIGSALGGIMLFANNAANSLSTENDDTVQGTSTVGQESAQTGDKTSATTATTSEYDWIGYMEKFLFPESDDQEGTATQDGSTHVSTMRSNTASTEEEEDSDGYLLQQALASARAIHHIHGIQFDEMQEINVLTDVKFVVVTVELPLGLLFQEHELGAWVSRVVPDGNGARKEIQPGDQLAAINGKSSAHATIDEVASIISATPKNEGVELTFLRYVGPLRPVPGAVIQEGFEVTDKNVSKKPKKGIFGKKKANQATGNKASLDFAPNKRRNKNLSISMTQEKTKTGLTPPRPQKGKSSLKLMFNRGKKKS